MRTSSLDDETVEKYRLAGRIAKRALESGREMAKEGVRALDLAERLEKHVRDAGALLAFPVNICINDAAAHYTPRAGDLLVFSRGDLVKIDVGVHIDGFIADTAATVEISTSNWSDLQKASEEALAQVLEMITPGIDVGTIGATVEAAISSRGYSPISNLTGHTMERNNLHAGIAVPNVSMERGEILKPHTAVAIEPFATNGKGKVHGDKGGNIYHIIGNRKVPYAGADEFLADIMQKFDHLPFAARWCANSSEKYEILIKKHWRHRNIGSYPVLSEVSGGMVSQSEHSVLVLDDSVIVYTR